MLVPLSILCFPQTPSDLLLRSRVHYAFQPVLVQSARDYSFNTTFAANGSRTNSDLTVVTALKIPLYQISGSTCVFSLYQMNSANASFSNMLLIVNATIDLAAQPDLSYPQTLDQICSTIAVSPFDGFVGSLSNVTIVGQVSVVNSSSNKTVYFSKLLGNVPVLSQRQAFFASNVRNSTSNLFLQINGQQVNATTNAS